MSVINFGVRDLNTKEIMIGQSGLVLLDKVASNSGVEKRKCRWLGHMERRGYKRGEKEERKRSVQKILERKKREKKRERREEERRERTCEIL